MGAVPHRLVPVSPLRGALVLLVSLSLALSAGCTKTLQIVLRAGPDTNAGRPLQALVRVTDRVAYGQETYAEVERLLGTPNVTVLRNTTVYPKAGAVRELRIPKPERRAVGLYFLFADPQGAWKLLVEPTVPDRIELSLLRDRIDLQSIKERRGKRAPVDPEIRAIPADAAEQGAAGLKQAKDTKARAGSLVEDAKGALSLPKGGP